MAVSNCLSAAFPAPILQMHSVQTAEPDESYCVVCRMTNVARAGICRCWLLARTIAGLRDGEAVNFAGAVSG